jgi:long-subunit fatty acid transport protein
MIKKFIIIFSLLASLFSFAQEGTSSPYSFYGIGDVKFRGNIEVRSMGEVSVIPDSIHINLQNPAMMSSIKLTTFSAAGTFSPVVLNTSSQTEKAQRTTLDYLAVVIPTKKFAIGFGLMPYSSVGYNILNRSTPDFAFTFNGSGGVNKVYTAVSFKLNKQFNFGIEGQYNFGEIETVNSTTTTIETRTRETNISSINGLNVNLGITHQAKINKKISIFSGLTYTPEANLNLYNTRNIAIIQFSANDQEIVYDQIDVDVPNSKIKSPSKISIGTSIGELKKWVVGAQVTAQSSSEFGNRVENISNTTYEDGLKFSFGGYYIPKYNSFTSYISKITYRGGFRYENTGLVINNLSILDRAVTFGLGLPLSGTFSNINIGFEFGKRGTTNAGLIEENYSNISFGFSFNDLWFQRRKYN